jgi:hypothetical protein
MTGAEAGKTGASPRRTRRAKGGEKESRLHKLLHAGGLSRESRARIAVCVSKMILLGNIVVHQSFLGSRKLNEAV